MSANTSIEWTDRSWNPVRGCSAISPGCVHCYAMKQAHRFSGVGGPYEGLTKPTKAGPQWTGQIRLVEEALTAPLRWRKPQRVFVNSMSDLFHEGVPDEFIDQVYDVMARTPQHTYQILTKRPSRMLAFFTAREDTSEVPAEERAALRPVLPHVWLGVSCEDQAQGDARIPLLLQTPAAVRWVSLEPLLGPIDLEAVPLPVPGAYVYGLRGVAQPLTEKDTEPDDWKYWTRNSAKLGWVVVGGESGPGARPCDVAWVRGIVTQCQAAAVSVFVKQLGAVPVPVLGSTIRDGSAWPRDRKGGDPAKWPDDLRVREFPRVEGRA